MKPLRVDMNLIKQITLAILCLAGCYVLAAEAAKPNIIYILADGHSTPGLKQHNDVPVQIRKPTAEFPESN